MSDNDYKILELFCHNQNNSRNSNNMYPIYKWTNIKLLDQLSDEAKTILLTYIKSTYTYNSGLHFIISNYFQNKSLHLYQPRIVKKKKIIGINYFVELTHPKFPFHIYLLGDSHTLEYDKKYCGNSMDVIDFLTTQFANSHQFIDYFVEIRHHKKHQRYDPIGGRHDNYMFETYKKFQPCFNKQNNCLYPNVRFHNADIRNIAISSISSDFGKLYDMMKWYLAGCTYGFLTKDSFLNVVKPYLHMTNKEIFELIRSQVIDLIYKQLNKCPLLIANKIICHFDKMTDIMPMSNEYIFQKILDNFHNIKLKSSYAHAFISSISTLQDYYTMSRIFRSDNKQKKGIYSGPAYNVVYFAGTGHLFNSESFLIKTLNFKVVTKSFYDLNHNCVNINNLKLPLFD